MLYSVKKWLWIKKEYVMYAVIIGSISVKKGLKNKPFTTE